MVWVKEKSYVVTERKNHHRHFLTSCCTLSDSCVFSPCMFCVFLYNSYNGFHSPLPSPVPPSFLFSHFLSSLPSLSLTPSPLLSPFSILSSLHPLIHPSISAQGGLALFLSDWQADTMERQKVSTCLAINGSIHGLQQPHSLQFSSFSAVSLCLFFSLSFYRTSTRMGEDRRSSVWGLLCWVSDVHCATQWRSYTSTHADAAHTGM